MTVGNILETVSPEGLRERAKIMRGYMDESCARHLELAAAEIESLRNQAETWRTTLRQIAEDSYLDEYEMEFLPTTAAKLAKAALSPQACGQDFPGLNKGE